MKINKAFLSVLLLCGMALSAGAQVENGGTVQRRSDKKKKTTDTSQVTDRMQSFFQKTETHDADLVWMREIYRQLDLTKDANTPLYFPEDVIDGQENLFRLMLRLVVEGKVPAYEYLDGREVFTDQYKIKVGDMLDRFGIYYTQKGGTSKNPTYVIEEADVPTAQVLNYYILERWEFDKRSNQMKTRVEAICPVLNRTGDFGGESRYPMFWVKFDALRPHLAQQYVFLTDDNNLPQYSLDDYFNLGMYDGEIYKTKNLRNLSMAQMYPDPEDRAEACDSIDHRLRTFGKDLWVPTREDYLAQREKEEMNANEQELSDRQNVVESDESEAQPKKNIRSRKTTKRKTTTKVKRMSSSNSSSAEKSVRRRKK